VFVYVCVVVFVKIVAHQLLILTNASVDNAVVFYC
jgi:hypothetical protein